jgi:malonyl-CoA/methylmalonyl-CoA synthetase
MERHFLSELQSTLASRASCQALTYRGRGISFAELETRASRFAGKLQQLGIGRGDRVALCTSDKLAFLTAHLGTLFAGAISLPLNPRFTADELRFFVTDSGSRVAVAGPEQAQRLIDLPVQVVADTDVWDSPVASCRPVDIGPDDACMIVYSSGTTGWPKGIVHTHRNVALSLRSLQACWRFTPDDAVVNVLPLFHVHGLAFATHLSLLSGGRVLIEDGFDPVGTLAVVGKGTVFMAVPTIYYKWLDQPEFRAAAKAWNGCRLFTCGSAPIRAEVLPELEAILQRPVINRYGMTEAFVISSLPLDGPWPQGSVGLPLDGIELRVVVEDGSDAPAGEVGTVLIRGPNLFRSYWGKPDATAAAFQDGWFDTGDLGSLDAGGFLTLVGRKNDLIITSGYNVYPQVVERVLQSCAGVQEVAVAGVPDRQRGERVVAFVVPSDKALTEQQLLEHCRQRLVDYQRPSTIIFVDALPRNAMGKVLRKALQERVR